MTVQQPDVSFQGREYPPTAPYQVGREKIREFAAAVGANHPSHHDVDAARALGYTDLVAPATFAVIIAQAAESQYVADPAAGIDFSRVVHADERFTHHRPIVAGDDLVTVLHVDKVTLRAGIAMVTTRCEIAAQAADGTLAPVSTVTSTLAVRGGDQ
jgi:acyl dehydratase